jgi:hypothetical protein
VPEDFQLSREDGLVTIGDFLIVQFLIRTSAAFGTHLSPVFTGISSHLRVYASGAFFLKRAEIAEKIVDGQWDTNNLGRSRIIFWGTWQNAEVRFVWSLTWKMGNDEFRLRCATARQGCVMRDA